MPARPTSHAFPWQRVGADAKRARDRAHDERRAVSEPWRAWYQGKRWRTLRAAILRRDPVCVACNRNPANECDHITPHKGDARLFWNPANLQGLCKPCHSRKTATEDSSFAPRTSF
jgi:5-methylcytosine-specific restriction protein A